MLTDDQKRRYARNITLAGIGGAGQGKLLAARVLVVGAGGLGSPCITYLAAAGVGHIGVVDHDRVELSNLQRQILHETADIGRFKAESARDRAEEMNPDVKIHPHVMKLDNANARELVQQYDLVADGSDNFATRFAVNEAALAERKSLVSAAIRAWEGQLAVFKSHEPQQPCYRCFVGAHPDDERGCNDAGILGAFAGVMGSFQALEVIKQLLGINGLDAGHMLLVDGLTLATRTTRITRDPSCESCGAR